jgi:c-di-GMP-binding flagellar brake protein YcgR
MNITAFYRKVSQLDLKELVDFINHNQTKLTIKINLQFVKADVTHIKNEKFFSVLKFHDFEFSNEPVICSFGYKDELYFFNSSLNNSRVEYLIDIPTEIFQLQRRDDFRVTVPIGLSHDCTINYVRGLSKNVKAEVRDLSMGGCQLSVAAYQLEIAQDDEFDIILKIDKFEFGRLNMIVKHIKVIKEHDTLLIGASFVELDGEASNDMRALLMYLDRKTRGKSTE